jgi:hypothetical protein
LKLTLVAVLFAVAGALSELLAGAPITKTFLGVAPAVLPFAILAAALCVRPVLRMPLVAVLICAVWAGAFWLAVALDRGDSYLNMFAAGLAGGLGVAAATAIGCRRLIHIKSVCLLAAAGTLAAAPFHWRVLPQDDAAMICAFAIWQCAVGTLLYALSER